MSEDRAPSLTNVALSCSLGGATHYDDLAADSLIAAGLELGLAKPTAERFVAELARDLVSQSEHLYAACEADDFHPGELRVLRQIVHGVVRPVSAMLSCGR